VTEEEFKARLAYWRGVRRLAWLWGDEETFVFALTQLFRLGDSKRSATS